MHFDALVVAIGGAARIGDLGDAARRRAQHADGGIHIPRRADGRIDQRRSRRIDGDRLLAEQEARHVEIVDHHVAEEAAGALDVFDGRRRGVARQDRDDLHRADFSGPDARLQRLEGRVEPAVEADHQRYAARRHAIEGPPDAGCVEVDGFFAEDRLARSGCPVDEVGMGVRRGADHNGVDVGRADRGVDAGRRGAEFRSDRARRLLIDVGNQRKPRPGQAGDVACMDAADAADTENGKAEWGFNHEQFPLKRPRKRQNSGQKLNGNFTET